MTERADRDLLALYVRLYFDEDVSRDIVENLRQRCRHRPQTIGLVGHGDGGRDARPTALYLMTPFHFLRRLADHK